VSLARGLYERFRLLIHEGAKFLVVGGVGAIVTIGGAEALHSLGDYVAVTISTITATIVTFLGNRYWTFRHRQGRGTAHESVMFFVLNGVGLLIYYGVIWIIRDLFGLTSTPWYGVALVVGTGLGTLFRFWSYRRWVWMLGQPPPTPAEMPESLSPVPAGPADRRDPANREREPLAPAPRRASANGRHVGAHRRT
jgi:putative flippase GtrA